MNMNREDEELNQRKRKKNNSHSRSPDLRRKNSSPDLRKKKLQTKKLHQDQQEEEDIDLQLTLGLTLAFRRRALPADQAPPPTPPPPPPPSPPPLVLSPLVQSISVQSLLSQNPVQVLPHQRSPPSTPQRLYAPLPLVPEYSTSSTPITCGRPSRPIRARRNQTQVLRQGKSDTIDAPFPWATTHRATVHSLEYLQSEQIDSIKGHVQCKRCESQYEMVYNLKSKFKEVGSYIAENKNSMHDRAPSSWMNPVLPKCILCNHENCVKPIISEKKRAINWLFLLLGETLGCCTLEQLKYFCKHTKNHRTGAKDRVLYLTYLELCKQLDPNGPFNR